MAVLIYQFPVSILICLTGPHLLLHSTGLTHQQSFAKVAITLLCNTFGQLPWQKQPFLLANARQNTAHLKHRARMSSRRSYAQDLMQCLALISVNSLLFCESLVSGPMQEEHNTSSMLGSGTLTARHLLLMGEITFEVELQQRIRRQVPMYFSMVRRKACCASLVRRSTSVSSTTGKR